jgi:Family of unknown function (DUF5759)
MNGPPRVDVPTLKPDQLFDKRRQRDAAKLKAYNKILEQIYGRIRTSSREGGDPWLIYTIPPVLLGYPLMVLQDVVVYLVYVLRQQNYEVRYTYPNLLYISWKHHEKEYILQNSPIMSAMLGVTPKQQPVSSKPQGELRGQRGGRVRFADQVQTQVQQPPPAPTIGRAPPRSVASYQPPNSFLDALERPVPEQKKSAIDDFLNF